MRGVPEEDSLALPILEGRIREELEMAPVLEFEPVERNDKECYCPVVTEHTETK